MKKTFVLFISIITLFSANCQINNDLIIEQIERMAEENEEENSDYSEMIEAYWSMVENPININSDEIDQLAEFKFISIFQLENIKSYIKNYGDILYIEELYEVDEFDEKSIKLIKPLIRFEDKNISDKIFLKDIFKYGKNKILFEVNQCLNKKKGYKDISDSTL